MAIMMVLLKIARLAQDNSDIDSWTDSAGYIACGYEAMIEDLNDKD